MSPASFPGPGPDGEQPPPGDPARDDDWDGDAEMAAYIADLDAGRARIPEEWEIQGPAATISLGDAADVDLAELAVMLGPDGLGPAPEHIAHIMGQSMEALIHHFKLVTEGFRVPAGQAYVAVESARGELGAHVVSDGGTRPYRVHFRDPSFTNLQSIAALCEGGQVADVIPAIASIDPVMGGVDR